MSRQTCRDKEPPGRTGLVVQSRKTLKAGRMPILLDGDQKRCPCFAALSPPSFNALHNTADTEPALHWQTPGHCRRTPHPASYSSPFPVAFLAQCCCTTFYCSILSSMLLCHCCFYVFCLLQCVAVTIALSHVAVSHVAVSLAGDSRQDLRWCR